MENIIIKSSKETPYFPEVSFDAKSGICEISGESYMEETYKFYLPLLEWIKNYTSENREPLNLVFKLIYLNTSTSKCILDMLEVARDYKEKGKNVEIDWYFDPEDPDMVDEVEDFEAEAGIDINLIEIK